MPSKIDLVVEAVRYTADGRIDLLRGYLRIDSTYTDRRIFTRDEIVALLKKGKKVSAGQRQPLLASTFVMTAPILLVNDSLITTTPSSPSSSLHVMRKAACPKRWRKLTVS